MKGIKDAVSASPATTIHELDLNPTTAVIEKPVIMIDSKCTV